MPAPQHSSVRDGLLSALPAEDYTALQSHLEPMGFELRQVLIEPNQPIKHVYFPEQGYASVCINDSNSKIEVGVIGREGMVGAAVALGANAVRSSASLSIQGRGCA